MSHAKQGEGAEEFAPGDNAKDPAYENATDSANDNAEMSDEDKDAIQIIHSVADQVHEVYEHPSIERGLTKAIDYIDESYLMDKARQVWNSGKFPDLAKWALIHIPQIHPAAPMLKILVRCGLLEYDENAVKDINSFDKMVMDKAISIGSLIEPALIPLTPFIKPIQRIMDAQERVFDRMREHLKDKHEGEMVKVA